MPETETDKKKSPEVVERTIFTINYKEGPVQRAFNFYAHGEKDAEIQAEKFIAYLSGKDNKKCMLIGKPKPFATDVDKEIARQKKMDEVNSPNVYPV